MKENPLITLNNIEVARIVEDFGKWVEDSTQTDDLRRVIFSQREVDAPLQVLEYPSKELELPTEPVRTFDSELAQLIDNMSTTMMLNKGVGLAANQVGILKRVVVVAVDGDFSSIREFVNPEIIHREGKITWQEGCLSFPTYFEFIDRAKRIKVKAQDRNGVWFEFECEGLTSVCLQHEIDHLAGKTFLERMSRIKRHRMMKKLKKKK